MAASKVVRARKKGQITIPDEFRRELGIGENSLLPVSVRDGELRIAPVEVRERGRNTGRRGCGSCTSGSRRCGRRSCARGTRRRRRTPTSTPRSGRCRPSGMLVSALFDTVIFERGLMSPFGRWGRLVFDRAAEYRLVVSEPVLGESPDLFRRPELLRKYRGLATRDVAAVLALLDDAEEVLPGAIPAVSRDPKDDPILATAVAAGAEYVVSEAQGLRVLGTYEGIRIVDAAALLGMLDGVAEAGGGNR